MDDAERRPIVKRYPPPLWETAIDHAIREAQRRGDFDDLPGRGRPIDLGADGDGDDWLANHMLRSQGFVPAWIEDDRAIAAERAALEALLEHAVERARRDGQAASRADADRAAAAFRERAEALNKAIERHNLAVPTASLHRRRIAVDAALAEFERRLGA